MQAHTGRQRMTTDATGVPIAQHDWLIDLAGRVLIVIDPQPYSHALMVQCREWRYLRGTLRAAGLDVLVPPYACVHVQPEQVLHDVVPPGSTAPQAKGALRNWAEQQGRQRAIALGPDSAVRVRRRALQVQLAAQHAGADGLEDEPRCEPCSHDGHRKCTAPCGCPCGATP